ncbi:MAG: ATP-binding cassette domain-containing protein [Fibrobacteres bacterium]|nr:ATP-binding cassette domain-containing protein [Fibrobacterota bacterium]
MSLMSVRDLHVSFPVRGGFLGRVQGRVRAVDGVSLELAAGETLALVGESGCGKSTTARAILRLLEPDSGQIHIDGQDLRSLDSEALRRFRRKAQIVFQDPSAALNPRRTAFQAVAEGLLTHQLSTGAALRERVLELFGLVGLSAEHLDRHPHEFSGGQRQRIGIARALAVEPLLLVLDEPVSALDVSVQAQVVNLLEDIQQRTSVGYLFVAHDMGVVRHIAHRIAVMYLGRIVESGPTEEICTDPRHPYTRMLIASVPSLGGSTARWQESRGELPSPLNPPSGCAFHPRCPLARPECALVRPELSLIDGNRLSACPVTAP